MDTKEILKRMNKGDILSVNIDERILISGKLIDLCYIKPIDDEDYYLFKISYNNNVFDLDSRIIAINTWTETIDGEVIWHDELRHRIEEKKKRLLKACGFKENISVKELIAKIVNLWDFCDEEEKEIILSLLSTYDFDDVIIDIMDKLTKYKKRNIELSDWKLEFKNRLLDKFGVNSDKIVFDLLEGK